MTSHSNTFIVSPGGRFREALDGGILAPLSVDPSRATDFLAYWRMEGITFALVPLVPGAASAPREPEPSEAPAPKVRHLTPANRAHLDLFTAPRFYEWAGLEPGDEKGAHEWLKARWHLSSLSELTGEQLTRTQLALARWARKERG